MMRLRLTSLLILMISSFIAISQDIADFENFGLAPDQFLNGSDGNGGFESGPVFLPNNYNANYDSFTAWAISSTTDTTTPGFLNQFSSIVGSGVDGSVTYATAFAFDPVMINLTETDVSLDGAFFTNNTFAFLSMRDGDGFAKKFGGVTGDDPDWFLLTIRRWHNGETIGDDIEFYLADFRFEDNSQDFIIDEWTWVSFETFEGNVDSLELSLSSSDVGDFGVNTPTYFSMDNFTRSIQSSATNVNIEQVEIYPNPTKDFLNIGQAAIDGHVELFNTAGKMVLSTSDASELIDVSALEAGFYFIRIHKADKIRIAKFQKI